MTSDIEMRPLPESFYRIGGTANDDAWDAEQMREYARANVAHATAAKDAEIEALRTEVALLRVGAENERLHQRGLLDRERDRAERLAEALRGMLDEYEALHAKYDLGDCQATVDARDALGQEKG